MARDGQEAPKAASPRFAKAYLDGLLDDPALTSTEKLVISAIIDLQMSTGWCEAGWSYLSRTLGRHASHVRNVVARINEKFGEGATRWRIVIRVFRGRGRTNLMRVIVPDDVKQIWRDPELAKQYREERRPRRRRRPTPPPDDLRGTLFDQRPRFNLFGEASRAGMNMTARLKLAVERGEVQSVIVGNDERRLVDVTDAKHFVILHVTSPSNPVAVQQIPVPPFNLAGEEFIT